MTYLSGTSREARLVFEVIPLRVGNLDHWEVFPPQALRDTSQREPIQEVGDGV